MRLHHVLGDAAEGAARVPAAPIAGRLLVGRMQRKARRVAEIGQQQHRRARQICLDGAEKAVAEHPRPLPQQYAGPPRQPSIDLRHDTAERLLAHQYGADRVLVLAEPGDDPAGMPARDAEHHLDPGLLQYPRDQRIGRRLFGQHRLDRHRILLPRDLECRSLPSPAAEDNAHPKRLLGNQPLAGATPCVLRDGAARLLRMRNFLNAIKEVPYPEEAAPGSAPRAARGQAPRLSRKTHSAGPGAGKTRRRARSMIRMHLST